MRPPGTGKGDEGGEALIGRNTALAEYAGGSGEGVGANCVAEDGTYRQGSADGKYKWCWGWLRQDDCWRNDKRLGGASHAGHQDQPTAVQLNKTLPSKGEATPTTSEVTWNASNRSVGSSGVR